MTNRHDAIWDADLEVFVHPVAAMFPKLLEGSDDRTNLEASISTMGQLDPVVFDGDVLLDGRNRMAICRKRGMEIKRITWAELDVHPNGNFDPITTQVGWILGRNIARRNLTEEQRTAIVLKARDWEVDAYEAYRKTQFKKGNDPRRNVEAGPKKLAHPKSGEPAKRDAKKEHASSTAGRIAAIGKISRYKAEQAVRLMKNGRGDLLDEVARGRKTLKEAVSELPKKARRKPTLELRVHRFAQKFVNEFASEKVEALKLFNEELT